MALALVMVMGLSYFEGGEETFRIEVLDALVACENGLAAFGIALPRITAPALASASVTGHA